MSKDQLDDVVFAPGGLFLLLGDPSLNIVRGIRGRSDVIYRQ
jgi:hypothetical protein